MKDTLQKILDQFGMELFQDSSRLLSIFADLAPKLKKERMLLNYFLSCKGNETLISALNQPTSQQTAAMKKVICQMTDQMAVSQKDAQYVCETFWQVIGGSPLHIALKPPAPPVPPAPMPPIPPTPPVPPVPPLPRKKSSLKVFLILAVVLISVLALVIPHLFDPHSGQTASGETASAETVPALDVTQPPDLPAVVNEKQLSQVIQSKNGVETIVDFHYHPQNGLLERLSFQDPEYDPYSYYFEYDNENRIKKIESNDLDAYTDIYYYSEFFYNRDGQLCAWDTFSPTTNDGHYELIYSDNRLVQISETWAQAHSRRIDISYDESRSQINVKTVEQYHGDTSSESYSEIYLNDQGKLSAVVDMGDASGTYFNYDYTYPNMILQENRYWNAVCYNLESFRNFPTYILYNLFSVGEYPLLFDCGTFDSISTDDDGYITEVTGTDAIFGDTYELSFIYS